MDDETLRMFCANDSDPRELLRAPWKDAGWIYATNGHWIVRVADDGRSVPERTAKHPKIGTKVTFDGTAECDFKTLPEIAQPAKCPLCDGSGRDEDDACWDCDGGGEDVRAATDIGDARFANHYLRRLAKLPGIAFCARPDPLPGAFRFDGGYGLLMPVRKD